MLTGIMFESLKHFKWRVVFAIVCAMSMVLEKSLFPYLVRCLIDVLDGVTDRGSAAEAGPVYMYVVYLILVIVVSEILYRCTSMSLASMYPSYQNRIRERIYAYCMEHNMEYFLKNNIGTIGSRMQDIGNNIYTITQMMLEFVLPISMSLMATVFLLFIVSPFLCVVFCMWVATHVYISVYMLFYKAFGSSIKHGAALNSLHGHVVDTLLNIVHVKFFNNYKAEIDNFNKHRTVEQQLHARTLMCSERAKVALSLSTAVGLTIIFLLALYQWRAGILSAGDLIFVMQVDLVATLTLWWLTMDGVPLLRVIGRTLQSLSALYVDNVGSEAGDVFVPRGGGIEFENVNFSYNAGKPLFEGLNLSIKAGERIAVIGLSGSGKTTLMNLLMRVYAPQSGSVKVDGQDVNTLSVKSLYKCITVVPQNVTLFNRSIMSNIRYGRENASYEEVVDAARKASCHEFIMELPYQYDSVVGDDTSLSHGQKQRILIARAILKDVPIIIMDEATSALDNITEAKVRSAISNLIENKTAIIIAHRLQTISIVDKVLVMQDGKVEGFGTPHELHGSNKVYMQLWDSYLL